MKRFGIIILFLVFEVHATAKVASDQISNAKYKYFYSMPIEASAEWAFLLPECSSLKESEKAFIKKCSPFANHEVCQTSQTIELSNAMTNKKKKFSLIYHVFTSKEKCITDRNAALADE